MKLNILKSLNLKHSIQNTIETIKNLGNSDICVIVPDKLSATMERLIFERLNIECSFNINVSTLNRLSKNILAETKAKYVHGVLEISIPRIEEEKPLRPKDHRQVGRTLAQVTRQALSQAQPLCPGDLKLRNVLMDCLVNHTTDHLAPMAQAITDEPDPEKQKEMMAASGIHSRFLRKAIIRRAGMPEKMPMELAAVSIGDFAIAFASVEMFDTNGKQLRAASPFSMTFSCGYSLNCHGYMPSAQAFPHGEYEADICRFLPGTGENIALTLCAELQKMKGELRREA